MSRAFVKENDLEHAGIDIPERPISLETNYVTPNGLNQLKDSADKLEQDRQKLTDTDDPIIKQKKMQIERDLRYFANRLKSAILINPLNQSQSIVLFSAKVDVLNESAEKLQFKIVGEDEADIKNNKISYLSPLAKTLIGSRVNDEVVWIKPSGQELLVITHINYNQ
ncbi:MAG: GreA/GreB family elongation factor [Methylophilaceae bacterium]